MNRKEMAEVAQRRFAKRRGGAKKEGSPERTGGQVLKLLLEEEEAPQEETPKKPQIVLYLCEDLNPAERNFTKVPNQMYALCRDMLNSYEEVLYRWVWWRSWGHGNNYCRFSRQVAFRQTSLPSDSTTKRAIKGLREKKFVVSALDSEGKPDIVSVVDSESKTDADSIGMLYRVFTPTEINNGEASEGVMLEDLPLDGVVCETQVTRTQPRDADNTDDSKDGSGRPRATENRGQSGPGHRDPGSWVTESQGQTGPGKPDTDDKRPVGSLGHTEPGQTEPPFKEDSLKDSLSPDPVKVFYTGIGQARISKAKREKGIKVIQELEADGFSLEDIAYAAEWTPKNAKEEVYDMEILKHTIGGAISAKSAEQEAAHKEREQSARVIAVEEEEQRLESEILKIRERISKAELDELRKRALEEIRNTDGVKEQFISEPLITAKENEILRRN